MADEPVQTSAPAASVEADAGIAATPQSDPTATQTDSKAFNATLDAEIESLWQQAEGQAPKLLMGEDAPPPNAEEPPATEPAKAEAPKTDAKPADQPPAATDPAEIERQVRAKIDAEAAERASIERRVRDEALHRQQAEAYVGSDDDYQAVNLALRQAFAGDSSALQNLDVVLPNGQTVSQVKGSKGLAEDEAANLLTAWDTARKYESVIGDRKVQRLVDLWNAEIMRTLSDPDVDASAVTKHTQPHQQMEALRESVRERVTKRLTEQHAEVLRAKDTEIKRQADRIESLIAERGNLTSNRAANSVATVDRPGQPGNLRTSVPTPEDLAAMPFDEAFKSGAIDRVLQSIPGGITAPRRRAG